MKGSGILKGLWITFRHLMDTYSEDIKKGQDHYYTEKGIEERRSASTKGIFSVQYPEEKLPIPENFRYIPFLVYRTGENGEKVPLCTSCGICAKVCPTQCISIERTVDPQTGRPVPKPAAFFIDIDICMNCGFCAEYCPFDAIKMDHDYELASSNRVDHHIYGLDQLLKPMEYYAKIRPTYYLAEEKERKEKESGKNLEKTN